MNDKDESLGRTIHISVNFYRGIPVNVKCKAIAKLQFIHNDIVSISANLCSLNEERQYSSGSIVKKICKDGKTLQDIINYKFPSFIKPKPMYDEVTDEFILEKITKENFPVIQDTHLTPAKQVKIQNILYWLAYIGSNPVQNEPYDYSSTFMTCSRYKKVRNTEKNVKCII